MLRHRMKSERGAAIVEFALVVPILLALVLGIAEFGRSFFIQSTMAGAAREGARAVALANPASGGAAAGTIAAQAALGSITGPTFSVVACPATNPPPPAAAPNATFTITWNMPAMTGMFGKSFKLTGKGVMRCNG